MSTIFDSAVANVLAVLSIAEVRAVVAAIEAEIIPSPDCVPPPRPVPSLWPTMNAAD